MMPAPSLDDHTRKFGSNFHRRARKARSRRRRTGKVSAFP
jgi:hypothetical protein